MAKLVTMTKMAITEWPNKATNMVNLDVYEKIREDVDPLRKRN